jgi:hypothetical protein
VSCPVMLDRLCKGALLAMAVVSVLLWVTV